MLSGQQSGWNKYTLANVIEPDRLWVPAIFAYFFTGYVCHLFYREYLGFVKKRLEYLVRGDMDTHQQTYYTLMVENIPPTLRSAPKLKAFFETLFPGDFTYSYSCFIIFFTILSLSHTHIQIIRECLFCECLFRFK